MRGLLTPTLWPFLWLPYNLGSIEAMVNLPLTATDPASYPPRTFQSREHLCKRKSLPCGHLLAGPFAGRHVYLHMADIPAASSEFEQSRACSRNRKTKYYVLRNVYVNPCAP